MLVASQVIMITRALFLGRYAGNEWREHNRQQHACEAQVGVQKVPVAPIHTSPCTKRVHHCRVIVTHKLFRISVRVLKSESVSRQAAS